MKKTTLAAALAVSLAFPAVASAHVTLQPASAPAGAYTRLDVRVPNEMDDADTTKIQLQLPSGFAHVSYEPDPSWTVQVVNTPQQVSQITWTGHGRDGRIPPGAFKDFGLSVQVPGKAGDTLTFKALQTYSNGEVVRWIGPAGTDNPAPQVHVTAASGARAEASSGSDGLAIVALIVGALGLATGAVALARGSRRMSVR